MAWQTGGDRSPSRLHAPDGGGVPPAERRREVGQGAVAVSSDPGTVLCATLGSCVAVCLRDPMRRAGGMNHIYHCLDPGPSGGGAIVADIERLVNGLARMGSRRADLQARVVGGAHVLQRGRDLGSEIAGVCLLYLAAERIPVLECTTGGTLARRVVFSPATGRLMLSYPGTTLPPVRRAPARPKDDWTLF